jgi:hypothetical protein
MTQVCCPSCRLRFTRAAAAHLVACPECGRPLHPVPSAKRVVGFRLASGDYDYDDSEVVPVALALALPAHTEER